MTLRNRPDGYGSVAKALHWLTVLLLLAQFALGYLMEDIAKAWFETDEVDAGDDQLVFVHAALGVVILVVIAVRLLWRRASPLPDWSERLTERDRRLEHRLEQLLYTAVVAIVLSGLVLLYASGEERELAGRREWYPPLELVGDDLALGVHVAGHVTLYVAVALHVGLAIRRRTLSRMV